MQTDTIHKFLDAGLLGLADFNLLNNHTSFGGMVYNFVMKCFVLFMTLNSEDVNCVLYNIIKSRIVMKLGEIYVNCHGMVSDT